VSESAIGLSLEIGLDPDADAGELEYATSQLRQELLDADVDRVDFAAGEPAPLDARGFDMAALGTLLVVAGRGAIRPMIQVIESWVVRRSSRSVKITIAGDSLELTNASREEQRRVVESFLARHESASP
jgi:hypothetical protein